MLPVNWNFDPDTTKEITQKMIDFVPDNEVPSKILNYLQQHIVWLVEKARNGMPELMLMHGGDGPREVSFLYFPTGITGAPTAEGVGAIAKVTLPNNITIDYVYNPDESVQKATFSDSTDAQNIETIEVAYTYSATTKNITKYTITKI